MPNIYDWLYDQYALPKLRNAEKCHLDALAAYAEHAGLTQKERLRLYDLTANMRTEWGTETFALGIKLGLRLAGTRPRRREPGWLFDFLP